MRQASRIFALLIMVVFLSSIFSSTAVTVSAAQGTDDTSSIRGLGADCYICLPKENVSEVGSAKYYMGNGLWHAETLIEKSVKPCWVLPCFFMPTSDKIVKVIYKKDGKK
ncbi:MAG: hypothetical protein M0R40_10355 [Firmicutes bacterium]|nr:hypothetical protein [Bacillota bacterium]